MSKQTEALKLALEALEETRNALAWFYDSYPQDVTKKGNELLPHVETVLTAIREALAEQPAQQQEPDRVKFERHWRKTRGEKKANRELPRHPLQPQTYIQDSANRHWVTWQAAVRSVSPQPAQPQEPVANGLPLVIAGAIFDFAGYLTTRDTVIEVGSTANASPVADLVKDWAALRGLSLADAAVLSWQEWLTDVRANDTSKERVDEMQKQRHDTSPPQPASKPWVGLTSEEVYACDQESGLPQREITTGDLQAFAQCIEAKLREKNA